MADWHKAPEVLDAARRWRDTCLLAGGSVFTDKRLWTLENLGYLDRYFVQSPDAGRDSFLDKLEKQLSAAPPIARQLAAEMLWLIYLCVSSSALKGATKRLQIRKVWEWSAEPLPRSPDELGDVLDTGVANPGPGFPINKWRECAFAIDLTRAFKALPTTEQRRLVDDPWAFAGWLEALPSAPGRQFRHMLLYLLFPEHFEWVVTAGHKKQIVKTLYPEFGLDLATVDLKDRVSVDRALYELRPRLADHYGTGGLDYYLEPLRSAWQGEGEGDAVAAGYSEPQLSEAEAKQWYDERFGNARVWALAAGEGARMWTSFRNEARSRSAGTTSGISPRSTRGRAFTTRSASTREETR